MYSSEKPGATLGVSAALSMPASTKGPKR
jgi:hypothetical protein